MNENEAQIQYEKRDSIELKRNAKGEYAWSIKTYFDPANDDIDLVLTYLKDTDGNLRSDYL